MERIWGPVDGFYLAAYASPAGDGDRFSSYAKVCWTRPDNYWDADCAFKIFGGEHHRSLEDALAAVAADARNQVSCLPPHASTLAQWRQRDHVTIPRLFAATFTRHRMARTAGARC
ncbi:hypothetical protein [Ramlibacter alkalitolerans]|uniref:Uncharacterized protein n=1 Tax=Ramlibacter alkalitolerans TaxID=2039631 RepID=A0ABS1JLG3_9BURK|nr:hypothetical protein [Ramlibacter alkalitolerans]MBL0425068.1 hypothetical protein [Ramlibacter alkalitolerans]